MCPAFVVLLRHKEHIEARISSQGRKKALQTARGTYVLQTAHPIKDKYLVPAGMYTSNTTYVLAEHERTCVPFFAHT